MSSISNTILCMCPKQKCTFSHSNNAHNTVTHLEFVQLILKWNAHLDSANTWDTLEMIIVLKNTVVNKVLYEIREISFALNVNR
jgi:hypothetical protein